MNQTISNLSVIMIESHLPPNKHRIYLNQLKLMAPRAPIIEKLRKMVEEGDKIIVKKKDVGI